ncbi:hypothetical protein [Teretinema zuelzerae]|uniref:hypothetical protein n=1 Tax=Teretinema zuelzerae TaxID=156 RepID=UPI001E3059E2|nr:hypothetical protein [Teretinema zuelzerae]
MKPDISVVIAGVRFANPVIAASGTFGYGTEFGGVMDVSSLGGSARRASPSRPSRETPAGGCWKRRPASSIPSA